MSSPLMVRLGQRRTMLVALPVACVSWVALAVTRTVAWLLLVRALQGVLAGVLTGPAVSYVVEVAHNDIRGSMTGKVGQEQEERFSN